MVASYLRVGYDQDGLWRTFGLRKDFFPAEKLQLEDDITASIVVPVEALTGLDPNGSPPAVKFVKNCEDRLFQRSEDATSSGYDKQTETESSQPHNFLSYYQ